MDFLRSANVEDLCSLWEGKQQDIKKDIQAIFSRCKQVERELRVTGHAPGDSTVAEQRLKLEQLMMHLTVDLQRINDKDNAKREFEKTVDHMRAKVNSMSQSLALVDLIDMEDIKKIVKVKDYSQKHYEALRQALKTCENLRSENTDILIDSVRAEIGHWYDMTRQRPPPDDDEDGYDCVGRELLLKLEKKLAELKTFYSNNTGILELYDKYVKLFQRMHDLETRATDTDRFHNRGGILLKEERERNSISSKLPKIEGQLTEMVQTFEQRTGHRFLVHGVELLTRISNEWRCYRLGKAQHITGSMRKSKSVPFVAKSDPRVRRDA